MKFEELQRRYGDALDDLKAAESKLARVFRRWNDARMRARRLELELDKLNRKLDSEGFIIEGEKHGPDEHPTAGVDPNGGAGGDRGEGSAVERDEAQAAEEEAEWIAANRDTPLGGS